MIKLVNLPRWKICLAPLTDTKRKLMMSSSTLKTRVKKIQRHLGITADGVIGPVTLTRIEEAIGLKQDDYNLRVSRKGLSAIVKFEVSSKAYYVAKLTKAVWPGGQSGPTIGIGYDLGYVSTSQIEDDWAGLVSSYTLAQILRASGKKGRSGKTEATRLRRTRMKVPYDAAKEMFYKKTLPQYAQRTRKAYPGVEDLPPDAQAMLLSLIYNRGASMSGSRRKEMLAIKKLVKQEDLSGIAQQIAAMKRLWVNKGLPGLLKRRDKEAILVKRSKHRYKKSDIVLL